MHASLFLANMAWNKSLGLDQPWEVVVPVLKAFESEQPDLWAELKLRDAEAMVDELVRFKRAHHPDDRRRILSCGIPEGKIRVEWLEPAPPGEDPGWEMQLFGLIMTGDTKGAIQFARKTWSLTEAQARTRVAGIAARVGPIPGIPVGMASGPQQSPRAEKPKTPKSSSRKVTKSDFLRRLLTKDPDLEYTEVNERWTRAGHPGEISSALYYQIRSKLGIKSVWGWFKDSDPTPTRGRRPASTAKKSGASGKSPRFVHPSEVYQFKITLKEYQPRIWRRIQVADCTLDKLHEHIQTAMGWTNSHLHHFRIGDQLYGDPLLMAETFEEMEYAGFHDRLHQRDRPQERRALRVRLRVRLRRRLGARGPLRGQLRADPAAKYPLCVEGERACPPEDVGGVWGYAEFVEAVKDPDHERHDELLEWIGGAFSPDKFHAGLASSRMRRGLPDWRKDLA